MKKVRVIVIRTAGTNCDLETKEAFNICGAQVDLVHINELSKPKVFLKDYHILAIPGGFTYGDDIASGKILANEMKHRLGKDIDDFIKDKKLIIGICNGFQVLVKAGLLPGFEYGKIEASLTNNDSGKFEDRWVYLKNQRSKSKNQKCLWTKGIKDIIYLPVAHGEGKFIPRDKKILDLLKKNDQIVFRYVDDKGNAGVYPVDPNGSIGHIAGICDTTGRILGMMPHPERHISGTQHPRWTREGLKKTGDGLGIFKNGVKYAKENL
ncbi:MAG: phosphoribosylformylglycinamidine synthase I [Candidatus Omnitrophota bacterium]